MIYTRLIEKELMRVLDFDEAIFILGARQVGKTSLMKSVLRQLDSKQSLYLDLEHPDMLKMFNRGLTEFLSFLDYQNFNKNKKAYIFIDEIQYADDFSGMVKYLVDHHSDKYKLIMSGSSSLQIRQQFKESLAGRKRIINMYPLDFSEFCLFKGETKLSELLSNIDSFNLKEDFLRFDKAKLNILLQEYLVFGGFPKVALSNLKRDKIDVLQDIANSYVLKDIRHIFRLEKFNEFNHLVKYLSATSGKEINMSKLGTETKLHKKTLSSYIEALSDGFVVKLINPYFTNPLNELRKTPKCYFLDNGLRNMLINNFNDIELRPDRGELLESYIFTQLLKKVDNLTEIKYWKTKSRQEVDFVIETSDSLHALEVKWNIDTQKHLKRFKTIYPNAKTNTVSMLHDFDLDRGIIPGYLI